MPAPSPADAAALQRLSGISLRSFEIFAAVADAGSMTAAAARFGISQSAVSQAIRGFELAIGKTLFDRTIRPPVLTLAGSTVRHHAATILGSAQALATAVGADSGGRLPALRIGMANSFAVTVGPLLLERVRHLATSWSIASGRSETRIEGLHERRVDLVITFDATPPPGEFLTLPVLAEPFLLLLPGTFGGEAGSLRAVAAQLDLVRYGPRLHLADQVETFLAREGVIAPHRYRLDSIDAVIAMVAAGLGWALATPLSLLKSAALVGALRCLELPGAALERRLHIVTRADEGGAIGRVLQEAAIEVVRAECLPQLRRLLPSVASVVRVGEEVGPLSS